MLTPEECVFSKEEHQIQLSSFSLKNLLVIQFIGYRQLYLLNIMQKSSGFWPTNGLIPAFGAHAELVLEQTGIILFW
jgi:hypothetical protein